MRIRAFASVVFLLAASLAASPASAQYSIQGLSDPATGETWHVEISGNLWGPTPNVLISSESLGIIGNEIDFVSDLGIEKSTFRQLRVAGRPARKHKFRFEYTPINYSAEAAPTRRIVFNGVEFPVTIPVQTDVRWRAFRFGYEYDFVYRDRGFVGLLLELKYTDIEASLQNVIDTEFVRARAPIPAIGGIGRVYVVPNISITGEFTAFKLPGSIDEDYRGSFYDFDLFGTVNFTDHVGAQVGYRSLTVFYNIEEDAGDLKLRGLYFGGTLRF
jgi:hypothetical protein